MRYIDTNDNLEEVKRNRAALNIKIMFVFVNEKTRVSLTRMSQRRKKEFGIGH